MRLLETYAQKINETLAGLPADVTITLHQCRGNREGNWAAEGGYDPVAEVLFNRINVDGYFLEYDTARAGGFEPLRFLPKGRRVVLGPRLDQDGARGNRRRAARAHRSGGEESRRSSSWRSVRNAASPARSRAIRSARREQEAKLARIVEVADKVWGNAMATQGREQKLDIFPHIFPVEFFERMKSIAEGNPGLAAALKRWMHIPVLWDLDRASR